MKSIQLYNQIKGIKAQMEKVPANAKDRTEQLYKLSGQVDVLEQQLAVALQEEADARGEHGSIAIGGGRQGTITEQAFGARSTFQGIQPGFRAAVTIPAGPAVTDPTIPAFPDYPRGFADTLIQAPTSGSVTFLQRKSKTNAAAQWKTADGAKPESSYEWEEASAPLTWIAHHTPVSKTEASDWGQLDGIIRNQMLVGLSQAKSREAISGNNPTGIVGVVNTEGILTYDVASDARADDTVYDTIRRMATKVMLTSGFMPTHVAMSPQAKEELDLLKGEDGHYLAINVDGRVWDMKIVQDLGLTTTDETHTHHGAIVYSPIGATWYTKEADNVEIGLVDDQFIKNAYTLLAEGRNALAVKYPDAFCHCADIIPAVALPAVAP